VAGIVMVARAVDIVIQGYQMLLRPLLPPACRFAPSCSEYARQVVRTHGGGRGLWLSVRRICRCHPFHPGGYDPPPTTAR
jgi:putative membrane protein insertion efficiency factor